MSETSQKEKKNRFPPKDLIKIIEGGGTDQLVN